MTQEFTGQDILNYISRFNGDEREKIMKKIFEDDLLQKFLSTSEGRLLIGQVADEISSKIFSLVDLISTGFEKNLEAIKQLCLEVKIARNFMYRLAGIVDTGNAVEAEVKKAKRK